MKRQHYSYLLLLIILHNYTDYSLADNFDVSLLIGQAALSDISRFNDDSKILVGEQLVDIYVNNIWRGLYVIDVSQDGQHINLAPKDINKLGLVLSPTVLEHAKHQQWVSVEALVKDIHVKLDISKLKLNISVPQIAIKQSEISYVDPGYWEYGHPAVILSYNTNYYNYKEKKHSKINNENFFATLNSGINLGTWQFRDESNYSYYSHHKQSWKNNTRYIYRPFSSIKSGLTTGDFYTPAALFSSIRIRGVSLASEINMLPNSSQNFVPVIRGIAQTNALVSVYQNNNLVFQENVPPGEFLFKDIQPSIGGGDLLVVIQEADGRKESFTVPYSAIPEMLKESIYRYNILAGQAQLTNTHFQPQFVQGEIHYGLSNLVTAYAGIIVNNKYRSMVIGSGWNFIFGSLSTDVTHADTDLSTGNQSGQSYRIAYSKYVTSTSTNLTLATYRYSTSGYYSFIDSIYAHDNYNAWYQYNTTLINAQNPNSNTSNLPLTAFDALRGFRAKNVLTVNLNQKLDNSFGSIFVSGSHRNYWNNMGSSREYQIGYANNYRDISYNISASRIRNYNNNEYVRYYLNINVPIALFEKRANISLGSYFTDSDYQQTTTSMSGIAGKDDQINYTLTGTNLTGGNNLIGGNVNYKHPYSSISTSYSEASNYRQSGFGARGTIVTTPSYLAFSAETGQTYTIIDAPMANNMMVNANKTTLTNKQGVVLVTNSVPYRTNTYTLAGTEKTSGADIIGNMGHITPYQGAVNYIKLETDQRQTFIFRASLIDQNILPFAAEVTDLRGQNIGNVGQSGILYIRSEQLPSALIIKLNMEGKKVCVIDNPIITLDKNRNFCR
ncbi:fimbria/pilus outer membrane usher protein [Providencia burhodogranariea]|uniref:Fimbrial biogenesis outer membrane usher protein n=1 Tax=Providencia burhodogranariea DSM 19968 TaxID=1141662 RepID=K8WXJ9_9GAMM|nr:fimbria/pilus outer membrane usher protein [Providencia burhodogranariea]EKT64656.1 fimbrial biogenesis outer membrane usher protein [Providencia burhodogranariea DSM 19968]